MKSPQIVHKTGILHLMVYCILFFTGCIKELPTVTTDTITNITTNSATGGGKVLDDGDAGVIACGVCWSTTQSPTVNDNKTIDGSGTGPFSSIITALTPNTRYYVKAYATNSEGTGYGNTVSFTTNPLLLATVNTSQVTSITLNSAESGGNVISDGGAEVIARGVCWNTSENPDLSKPHTEDGAGTGSFTSNISGLIPDTKYYVKAYATNSVGTTYGDGINFSTIAVKQPTLTTNAVTEIAQTSAKSGGNITDDGGAEVIARGVCWNTSVNPDLSGPHTEDGAGTGNFFSNISDLIPATKYYVSAYATNSAGTTYGDIIEFSTNSLTDLDGNIYKTVQIGRQIWMAENLRVTKYRNGDNIPLVMLEWENFIHDGAYTILPIDPLNGLSSDAEMLDAYGALYNWYAVMDLRGLCPTGWRVPGHNDWTQMEQYICNELGNTDCATKFPFDNTTVEGTNEGNALKSCRQVSSPLGGECATSRHPRWDSHYTHYGTDEFGFSALPGGRRHYNGNYDYSGGTGFWWTSTDPFPLHDYPMARCRNIYNNSGKVNRQNLDKHEGLSVRCVRDFD